MAEVDPRSSERAATVPLAVRTIWTPACARVILIGELDLSGVETVEGCVNALLSVRPSPGRVVVDLRELRFVDVVGVRTLITACWRLRRIGPLQVSGVQPAVQRVLELAGVSLSTPPQPYDGALVGPFHPGRRPLTGL